MDEMKSEAEQNAFEEMTLSIAQKYLNDEITRDIAIADMKTFLNSYNPDGDYTDRHVGRVLNGSIEEIRRNTVRICPVCGSESLHEIIVTAKLSLTISDHDETVAECSQDVRGWMCERKHRHVDDGVVAHAFNNLSDAIKHNIG